MKYVDQQSCEAALSNILSVFGTGDYRRDGYVFDGITRLPIGMKAVRMPSGQLLDALRDETSLWVVFDPNVKNRASVITLLRHLDVPEYAPGLAIEGAELSRIFDPQFIECDFYITTPLGKLLGVASHEDEVRNGERIIWCPFLEGHQ
jgi:hypothetical protein